MSSKRLLESNIKLKIEHEMDMEEMQWRQKR